MTQNSSPILGCNMVGSDKNEGVFFFFNLVKPDMVMANTKALHRSVLQSNNVSANVYLELNGF